MGALQTKRRPVSPARRKRIFKARDGIFGYCGKAIGGPYETGHLPPLARGGADDDGGDTVPMHVECHRLKTFGRKRRREGRRPSNRQGQARPDTAERRLAARRWLPLSLRDLARPGFDRRPPDPIHRSAEASSRGTCRGEPRPSATASARPLVSARADSRTWRGWRRFVFAEISTQGHAYERAKSRASSRRANGAAGGAVLDATISRLARSGVVR